MPILIPLAGLILLFSNVCFAKDNPYKSEADKVSDLRSCPKTVICQEHDWDEHNMFCSLDFTCDMCYGHFAYSKASEIKNGMIILSPNNKKIGKCTYSMDVSSDNSFGGYTIWKGNIK